MSEKEELTDQLETVLTDFANEDTDRVLMHRLGDDGLIIEDQNYVIVENYREGFDLEAFQGRYDEYFAKYDFIVGDWAADQLRLRGFYQLNRHKVPRNRTIDYLQDYLKEYCNFGCAYFVIGKEEAVEAYDEALDTYRQKRQRQLERNQQKIERNAKGDRPQRKKRGRGRRAVRTQRKHKGSFLIRKKGETS